MLDSVNPEPAQPVPAAKVASVTDLARQNEWGVDKAATLARNGPPVDAQKVTSLKAAISSGIYSTDLANIATGVIRFSGKIPD